MMRYCYYDPVLHGMSPGCGCNVAVVVKGPLAVGDPSNVAHGKAERVGAVTPENFCTFANEVNE